MGVNDDPSQWIGRRVEHLRVLDYEENLLRGVVIRANGSNEVLVRWDCPGWVGTETGEVPTESLRWVPTVPADPRELAEWLLS